MPLTLVEKLATRHSEGLRPGESAHSGDFIIIRPRHVMTHDNTGAEIVFDDAVILPAPMNGAPPPAPPPMAPMAEARRLRHDEARQALSDLRHPVLPPKDKDPVKRALEEHFAR